MITIFDTQVAHYLLDENDHEHGLKALTRKYLHKEVVEYKYAIIYGSSSKEFRDYATEDAINTFLLFKKFSPQLEKEDLHHLAYDIEFPFTRVLSELFINGIKADIETANDMLSKVQHLYYEIENQLLEMFGGKYVVDITPRGRKVFCKPSINFNSSKQVIPLIESLGFEIYEKSKKGSKSWGKAAKKRLEGKHPAIDLLIKLSKVEKLLSSFLKPFQEFVENDNRIRCSFNNTVTVTGRLSCSNPNIEQLPKNNDIANIRNLFVSSNDTIFIVADYSGQELRIAAVESNDNKMLSELKGNYDIHLAVANNHYNLGLIDEQLIDGTEAHKEAKTKYKTERDNCKPIGFGIIYGKGAYGFAKDFNCTEKEAQLIIDKFLNRYPGLKQAIEKTRQQIYQHGYVTNMSGRKRRFPDFHKKNKWGKERCYRQGFNFKVQSFGADMIKAAAIKILKDSLIKVVNIVHDELVFEVQRYYKDTAVEFIRDCMENAIKFPIPLEIDISSGERYGQAKS